MARSRLKREKLMHKKHVRTLKYCVGELNTRLAFEKPHCGFCQLTLLWANNRDTILGY